jgi:DNA-binding MarR family transcriptional regulator
MQRRTNKASVRTRAPLERAREASARAVRAIVFVNRLFEYECREFDVSLAQYRLLLYLRHGPKRAGELATQASMTRPALSALIAAMEQARLIRRRSVASDRRGVRLELARRGSEALEKLEARFTRVLDDVSENLDRDGLVDALSALCSELNSQVDSRVRPVGFEEVARTSVSGAREIATRTRDVASGSSRAVGR